MSAEKTKKVIKFILFQNKTSKDGMQTLYDSILTKKR